MNDDKTPMDDFSPDAGAPQRPLGYWLRAVDALISREFAAAFDGADISRGDWMLLAELSGEPVAPPRSGPPRHAGKRLRRLADRGWVDRSEAGTWLLTDEGRAAHERLAAMVEGIRSRVAGAVSPADFATTLASLEAIARELGGDERMPHAGEFGRGRRFGPRGRRFGPGACGRGFGPDERRGHGFGPGAWGHGFPGAEESDTELANGFAPEARRPHGSADFPRGHGVAGAEESDTDFAHGHGVRDHGVYGNRECEPEFGRSHGHRGGHRGEAPQSHPQSVRGYGHVDDRRGGTPESDHQSRRDYGHWGHGARRRHGFGFRAPEDRHPQLPAWPGERCGHASDGYGHLHAHRGQRGRNAERAYERGFDAGFSRGRAAPDSPVTA